MNNKKRINPCAAVIVIAALIVSMSAIMNKPNDSQSQPIASQTSHTETKPFHPESYTFWCDFTGEQIYFTVNSDSTVTVSRQDATSIHLVKEKGIYDGSNYAYWCEHISKYICITSGGGINNDSVILWTTPDEDLSYDDYFTELFEAK